MTTFEITMMLVNLAMQLTTTAGVFVINTLDVSPGVEITPKSR